MNNIMFYNQIDLCKYIEHVTYGLLRRKYISIYLFWNYIINGIKISEFCLIVVGVVERNLFYPSSSNTDMNNIKTYLSFAK